VAPKLRKNFSDIYQRLCGGLHTSLLWDSTSIMEFCGKETWTFKIYCWVFIWVGRVQDIWRNINFCWTKSDRNIWVFNLLSKVLTHVVLVNMW